jgi:hypothetical protein
MMSEHLSQAQLAGYRGRTLYPDELLAADRHLASCDECHERLTRILPAVGKLDESREGPFHLDYDQHLEPYVDGRANDIDREIVDSHVAVCSECAADLKDLLAFKQPPVAVVPTSSRWKQWWPQWRLLPNPALATAVVIAVFIVAMAVLLWATYPTSRRNERVGTGSPEPDKKALEQPSPPLADHATRTNSPATQPTPAREEPLIVLNDAGGQVIVNQRGRLEGLDELPPDLRDSVERVLVTRKLHASPALTGWTTGAANLRSEFETQSTFAPLNPLDVVIETDRPTFRWRALEDAHEYIVTIYDAKLRQVGSSGPVDGTEWTTANSLERGFTYSWQISASQDGKKVVSPKPPLPEARFRILDEASVVALAKVKESAGSSHLALGVFYWTHGMIEESEREFQALANANPNSPAATQLLRSIRHR